MKKQTLSLKKKILIGTIIFILVQLFLLKFTLFKNFDVPFGNLLLVLGIVWVDSKIINFVEKIEDMYFYRRCKQDFKYVRGLHKLRYQYYFLGDKEKIEEYTRELEKWGNVILKNGEQILKIQGMKKQHEEVRQMMEKTEEMLEKEFVEY